MIELHVYLASVPPFRASGPGLRTLVCASYPEIDDGNAMRINGVVSGERGWIDDLCVPKRKL